MRFFRRASTLGIFVSKRGTGMMKRGIALLILATIFWGGNYICGRYLGPLIPATLLNTIRWVISTLILVGILRLHKKSFPVFKYWKIFSILGFTGGFAFSTLNYIALNHIPVSQAGMVSAGIPVMILIFSILILKEKVTLKIWICTALSIIGVIILFQGESSYTTSGQSLLGNTLVILASLSWGVYTVLNKKYTKQLDSLTLTAGAAFYGTIFSALSCIGTVDASSIQMTGLAWICLLYVSTLASVGAYLAWNTGVNIVGASKASPYINMLPVWTVIFGMLLLKEEVSLMAWIGGAIIFMGALFASTPERGKLGERV